MCGKMLSTKQQKFVDLYCSGKTGAESARLAGYSQKRGDASASKLLRQEKIKAAVAAKRAESAKRTGISIDWVQEQLVDTYHAARSDADFKAANRALELIGKYLGMFKDTTINVAAHQFIVEAPVVAQSAAEWQAQIEQEIALGVLPGLKSETVQ